MKMIYNIQLVYRDSILACSPHEALQSVINTLLLDPQLFNYAQFTIEADNEEDHDEARIP